MLNIHMTGMAKDQRFPFAGSHDLYPLRLLSACVFFQVFERSDVMNLDSISGASCSKTWKNTDRKSTRLNSSHTVNSYAVFCLKKKNKSANGSLEEKKRTHT